MSRDRARHASCSSDENNFKKKLIKIVFMYNVQQVMSYELYFSFKQHSIALMYFFGCIFVDRSPQSLRHARTTKIQPKKSIKIILIKQLQFMRNNSIYKFLNWCRVFILFILWMIWNFKTSILLSQIPLILRRMVIIFLLYVKK